MVAVESDTRPIDAERVTPPRRRRPRLVLASAVLASPGWIAWGLDHRGLAAALATSAILAVNVVVTRRRPGLKRAVARLIQRYLLNPTFRVLFSVGILPLGIVLLETTGRNSGRLRRTPVGEGLEGDTLWIVAEHGYGANYVRNIEANPMVRVKVRRRLWPTWQAGTATVLDDDDPHARQRQLCRHHPLRAINAALVRTWGTELVTVRIDLAPIP